MKLIYLSILALLPLFGFSLADPIDKAAELIGKGNSHELAGLFAPNVDITMAGRENIYSKTQAEIILDRFFARNKPMSYKVMHKVNTNSAYSLGVVVLNTDRGRFRISYTFNNMQLIELRIEAEK